MKDYKKSLAVIKQGLIFLGGGFMIGYLLFFRPTLGESATIIAFTIGTVILTAIENWFYRTVLCLISVFSIVLYILEYMDSVKQLITMLLVAIPMISAVFLEVVEQESKKKGEM
ncbi:hypothetical protein P9D51_22675 [Bacillus sonorensis]|uniref:hypothetical protein n=1 Tax=Bacillus sonorensis TaxID=119858 RepID=UPI001F41A491|nr:hypothetical protein [Bacillus sonorensis]MCF7617388.1 hypothetical protein [Bacillus sonorensis]MCY8035618.1 hypothetical protein [Bacillus sonorensis]MCY8563679.1 hypothetical protein [Bacillus sonorensis]MEC1428849.1 hypothetical protein [Bacillus sonorensis]